jgi:hypothetical protein
MNVQKLFSGTVTAATTSGTCSINGTSRTHYPNITTVIYDAICSTLAAAGIPYTTPSPTTYRIATCNAAFHVLATSTAGAWIVYTPAASGLTASIGTGVAIGTLSSTTLTYNFYITIKGDISTGLCIYIGSKVAPTALNLAVAIVPVKKLEDNTDLVGLIGSVATTSVYLFSASDVTAYIKIITILAIVNDTDLPATEIAYYPLLSNTMLYQLPGCIMGRGTQTAGTFYLVDTELYYALSAYILIKCTVT